jgi:hypothetical protein
VPEGINGAMNEEEVIRSTSRTLVTPASKNIKKEIIYNYIESYLS